MANHIFVKPVPGSKPRHETTHQPLTETGEYWEDTPYTRRRLRDGDIVQATDPASQPAALSAQPTTLDVGVTTTRKPRSNRSN